MISAKKILLIILVLCLCTVKSYAVIKDSLFATVGNKAITKFDIIREIKIILITRNQPFSEENRSQLETALGLSNSEGIAYMFRVKAENVSQSIESAFTDVETITINKIISCGL